MKNKKRKIYLSNKLFYSLIVVLALLLIGVGVYAYNPTSPDTLGTPSVMGHTLSEIMPPYDCQNKGSYVKYSSGVWTCGAPSTGLNCNDCQYSFADLSPLPYGCDTPGEYLKFDGQGAMYGTWKCGNIPVTSVVKNSQLFNDCVATRRLDCPSGKNLIGGGCFSVSGEIQRSYPSTSTGPTEQAWFCKTTGTSACTIYTICANY